MRDSILNRIIATGNCKELAEVGRYFLIKSEESCIDTSWEGANHLRVYVKDSGHLIGDLPFFEGDRLFYQHNIENEFGIVMKALSGDSGSYKDIQIWDIEGTRSWTHDAGWRNAFNEFIDMHLALPVREDNRSKERKESKEQGIFRVMQESHYSHRMIYSKILNNRELVDVWEKSISLDEGEHLFGWGITENAAYFVVRIREIFLSTHEAAWKIAERTDSLGWCALSDAIEVTDKNEVEKAVSSVEYDTEVSSWYTEVVFNVIR
jgi:hypothetical protein